MKKEYMKCHKNKHLKDSISIEDMSIYQKAINRMKNQKICNQEKIIIALEKEIDSYRDKIKNQNSNPISFQVNQNVVSERLHNFLLAYVPMGQVLNLYRFLKKDFERN